MSGLKDSQVTAQTQYLRWWFKREGNRRRERESGGKTERSYSSWTLNNCRGNESFGQHYLVSVIGPMTGPCPKYSALMGPFSLSLYLTCFCSFVLVVVMTSDLAPMAFVITLAIRIMFCGYGRTSVPTKRTWSENFVILWFSQSNILAISFSRWNVEHNEQAATDMKDHEVPKLTWSRGPHRLKPTRKPGAEPGSGLSQILISGQGRADKTMECMWLDISCSGSKKN